jgi:hypothetical protein
MALGLPGWLAPCPRRAAPCAGTFIYVGCSEIIEEEFEGDMRSGRTDITQQTARYVKFVACLAGVAAIACAALIPDEHAHGHGMDMHAHGHAHHHHH